ncbi:hypothetical protein [Methylomicrobium sp. Wu6]|uniref:hypothetical protein n=1 Tax=Methylomicrobium sp. Wu6 TaxID=3107928 RepID=UPI002DD6231F|nr:hypothetical protein [Methylomicrobium sp. Wu6]MEC4746912.1 hypothetical protein [Methylomicrobium sp. Wu6]
MRHLPTPSKHDLLLACCCAGAFAFSATSPAQDLKIDKWLPESVQVHGFLSQGFIHTSDNNFFGHSNDSLSTDFRELGINGSWSVSPDLQLAMQVVWRNAGQTDEGDLRIDYGVANYNLLSTESSLLAIRAGRVPTPLGFYNETRDVAATRPSILLPQSIYFDANRNLALSADGGYLYGEHRTEFGDFSFNFGLIIPRTDDPDFRNVILRGDQGSLQGDTSWITRVEYESPGERVRLGLTYADFLSNFHSSEQALNQGSFHFNPLILSAQYNAEKWSLTAEYALRRTRFDNFTVPDFGFTGQSYYIQGTYHFTDKLEGLVRYDELIWDLNDQYGYNFPDKSVPSFSRYARDWTFGLRYEILPSLMLSTEYHRINGTGWLSRLENPQSETQRWDMYAFMLSYSF